MRRLRSAIWAVPGVLPLLVVLPVLSQISPPPLLVPPPPAPLTPPESLSPPESPPLPRGQLQTDSDSDDELSRCDVVGQTPMPEGLQQQLDQQYERAAIDFRGITVAQVESTALQDYVPVLCPTRSRQIQELFAPLVQPAG